MRRAFSITAIVGLICSAASPLLAAACPHSQAAMACHGVQAQHANCPNMHHRSNSMPEERDVSSLAQIRSVESPASCPMDCCTQGHPEGIAAARSMTISPMLAQIAFHPLWSPVVFTRNGFSSHTDRGPPLA